MTVVMHGAISEYVLGPPMQDDIIFGRVLYATDRLASTSGETTENLHGVKVFDMCTCMEASNSYVQTLDKLSTSYNNISYMQA